MCQNVFFPCLQETRIRRSKREEQKTDEWSDKKEDTTVGEKFKNKLLKRIEHKICNKFSDVKSLYQNCIDGFKNVFG